MKRELITISNSPEHTPVYVRSRTQREEYTDLIKVQQYKEEPADGRKISTPAEDGPKLRNLGKRMRGNHKFQVDEIAKENKFQHSQGRYRKRSRDQNVQGEELLGEAEKGMSS